MSQAQGATASSGSVFMVVAPSGAGKSTLVNALLRQEPDITLSVSYTTRPPRPGEQHGREYYFTDADDFRALGTPLAKLFAPTTTDALSLKITMTQGTTPEEYDELKHELEQIYGEPLTVYKRLPKNFEAWSQG